MGAIDDLLPLAAVAAVLTVLFRPRSRGPSPNFTWGEVYGDEQSYRSPGRDARAGLVADRLELIRAWYDSPVDISSWARSPEHNHAVGGSDSSDHVPAGATDFTVRGVPSIQVGARIRSSALVVDQVIVYHPEQGGHVHMGVRPTGNRNQFFYVTAAGDLVPLPTGPF